MRVANIRGNARPDRKRFHWPTVNVTQDSACLRYGLFTTFGGAGFCPPFWMCVVGRGRQG